MWTNLFFLFEKEQSSSKIYNHSAKQQQQQNTIKYNSNTSNAQTYN